MRPQIEDVLDVLREILTAYLASESVPNHGELIASDVDDAADPERRETILQRVIRDTAAARALKLRHHNQCHDLRSCCSSVGWYALGTVRIFRAENEVGRLFQQPGQSSRIAPWRTVIWVMGSPEA